MIGLNSASARSRCINIAAKKRTDRGDYIEKVCPGNSGTGFFYILLVLVSISERVLC